LPPNTSSHTSPHYETSDDVRELLERSALRLSDAEHSEDEYAGDGVLVKLFTVDTKASDG
jgi:hypothetical protein